MNTDHTELDQSIEKRIKRARTLLCYISEAEAIRELAATRICSEAEALFAVKAAQILLQAESDDK